MAGTDLLEQRRAELEVELSPPPGVDALLVTLRLLVLGLAVGLRVFLWTANPGTAPADLVLAPLVAWFVLDVERRRRQRVR